MLRETLIVADTSKRIDDWGVTSSGRRQKATRSDRWLHFVAEPSSATRPLRDPEMSPDPWQHGAVRQKTESNCNLDYLEHEDFNSVVLRLVLLFQCFRQVSVPVIFHDIPF